jgi:hypothetical protein
MEDGLWMMDGGFLLREPVPDEWGTGNGEQGFLLRELTNLPSKPFFICLFRSELSECSQVILLSLIAKSLTYKKYFTVAKSFPFSFFLFPFSFT